MTRIAFLGMGAMGRRMVKHLVEADGAHEVVVFNRTAARAEGLGAPVASSPADAARDRDVVISMVTDDAAARALWLDPDRGALGAMTEGALAIEASTVTPTWIATLGAAADDAGVRLLDAPVVGSTPQAEAAALCWLLGGDAETVAEADPVLARMGNKRLHVGPAGHGAAFKLVVNALFATQVAALSELLAMATTQGLTPAVVAEHLATLPVTSPAAAGVLNLMVRGDHAPRFPIDLVHKDLTYAVDSGAGPLITEVAARFEAASRAGRGDDNLSAV